MAISACRKQRSDRARDQCLRESGHAPCGSSLMTQEAVSETRDVPTSHVERIVHVPLARWALGCALGELMGFSVAAISMALAFTAIPHATTTRVAIALLIGCLAAGAIEGSILGACQWWALSRVFPRVRAFAWILVTALGGALGWLVGSFAAALAASASGTVAGDGAAGHEPTLVTTLLVSAGVGSLLGLMIGSSQWLVLRRHAASAGVWVPANILGWMLALPWSYLAGRSVVLTSSPVVFVLVLAGACVLMGLTLALVTGAFLRSMAPIDRAHGPELTARELASVF
jgi:hypothetical protein